MITTVIRTQIQLTPAQASALKAMAAERGVSMAELIRRSVDDLLSTAGKASSSELRSELKRVFGAFSSGTGDLGRAHDAYVAESIAREPEPRS